MHVSSGIVAADASSSTEKTIPAKLDERKSQSASEIEDLFKDSSSIAPSTMSGNPQKDVKNDIMSLFEKVCFVLEKHQRPPTPLNPQPPKKNPEK